MSALQLERLAGQLACEDNINHEIGQTCATCGSAISLDENPYVQPHVDAEMDFSAGGMLSRRQLRSMVESEFLGMPGPRPCPCGGVFHWKATIGAAKCGDCTRLQRYNGEIIGGPK